MIDRLARLGGLLFFVLGVLLVGYIGISEWAGTLTLTSLTSGQTGSQIMTTINANNNAIVSGWTKLTDVNIKEGMTNAEKIDGDKINLTSSCGAGDNGPCITPAMIDPNSPFITAAATSGAVAGFGPLRAHAQATPDNTLKVEAGNYIANGLPVVYAGGNSPSISPPAGNARISTLALDSAGLFSDGISTGVWVHGDVAASPAEPVLPWGLTPLAEVYCPNGKSMIKDTSDGVNCYLYRDARPIMVDNVMPYGGRGINTSEFFDGFDFFENSNDSRFGLVNVAGCPAGGTLPTTQVMRCSGAGATASTLKGPDAPSANEPLTMFNLARGGAYMEEFRIKIVTQGTNPDYEFGVSVEDAAIPTTNYIAIVQNVAGSSFSLETANGAAPLTSSAVAWTPSNWNTIRIVMTSSSVTCYLNGRLVATNTGATLPVDAADLLRPYFKYTQTGGGNEWLMDYLWIKAIGPMLAS